MATEDALAEKSGRSAGITAAVLVTMGVIQVVLGATISKSVALTANGIDCIGDGFVSAVVWVGLRFFRKPADDRFHYGYFRIENLASIAAAGVMMALATYILARSYARLRNPETIEAPMLGAGVAFVAALIAWGMGIRKYLRGRRSNMGSVRLEAFNTIKDGTASFSVVVALILASRGYPVADAVVGFGIAGVIITIGFAAVKESSLMLVDACDGICVEKGLGIRLLAEQIEGVHAARVVRLRRTGPVFQGELEIAVSPEMSVEEFDRIRSKIQREATTQFQEIARLTVTSHPHRRGEPEFEEKDDGAEVSE